MSFGEVALVPPGMVTVTLTDPAVCAVLVAVILVGLVTRKLATEEPKLTDDAPVKLDPVIVTLVPPLVGPVSGLTELTVGDGAW